MLLGSRNCGRGVAIALRCGLWCVVVRCGVVYVVAWCVLWCCVVRVALDGAIKTCEVHVGAAFVADEMTR